MSNYDFHMDIFNKISSFFLILKKMILLFIIFILIAFILILFIYFGDILINSILSTKKGPLIRTYVIVSQSMVPTINVDDAVIVLRLDNDSYKKGDIITFISNEKKYGNIPITHRIINKDYSKDGNSTYTTKGDNNMFMDPFTVYNKDIYGKVVLIIPKVGLFVKLFSRPSSYFIIFIFSLILYLLICKKNFLKFKN